VKNQSNGAYGFAAVLVTVVNPSKTAFATAIDVRPPTNE